MASTAMRTGTHARRRSFDTKLHAFLTPSLRRSKNSTEQTCVVFLMVVWTGNVGVTFSNVLLFNEDVWAGREEGEEGGILEKNSPSMLWFSLMFSPVPRLLFWGRVSFLRESNSSLLAEECLAMFSTFNT